jgi:hypothetical protein
VEVAAYANGELDGAVMCGHVLILLRASDIEPRPTRGYWTRGINP